MTGLTPFETLYDISSGPRAPLTTELVRLYGPLAFPTHPDRPHVISNFVATLDGVVALGGPGPGGGPEISGFDQHDRVLMGLLRAVADAIVVGAGTVRSAPTHRWSAAHVFPALSEEYQALRRAMGKVADPLLVIVTGAGQLDPSLSVLSQENVLIITTPSGAARMTSLGTAANTEVAPPSGNHLITAETVVQATLRDRECGLILVEGGPRLMAAFLREDRLDELFLTVAPQIAGRSAMHDRDSLVMGEVFAPFDPLWVTLLGVRRSGSHLFLRYGFSHRQAQPTVDLRLRSS